MPPKTVKIGSCLYKYEEVDNIQYGEEELLGMVHSDEEIIQIKKNTIPRRKRLTIIHELVHAAAEEIQLAYSNPDDQERNIELISRILAQILEDNKELLLYLAELEAN